MHMFSPWWQLSDRKATEKEKDKSRSDLATSISKVGEAIRTQATESVMRNINVLEKQLLDVELKLLEMPEDSPGHELHSKCKNSLTKDIDKARKRMKPPPTPGSTQSSQN